MLSFSFDTELSYNNQSDPLYIYRNNYAQQLIFILVDEQICGYFYFYLSTYPLTKYIYGPIYIITKLASYLQQYSINTIFCLFKINIYEFFFRVQCKQFLTRKICFNQVTLMYYHVLLNIITSLKYQKYLLISFSYIIICSKIQGEDFYKIQYQKSILVNNKYIHIKLNGQLDFQICRIMKQLKNSRQFTDARNQFLMILPWLSLKHAQQFWKKNIFQSLRYLLKTHIKSMLPHEHQHKRKQSKNDKNLQIK